MPNTINGLPLLRATVLLPRQGIWTADVQVQSGEVLEGQVTIELAGLVLRGTVEDGGSYRERGWYRIAGGNLTWREQLAARGYRNEAGVKLSTVVTDAAREAGERLQEGVPTTRLGPGYVRLESEPARTLDLTSPDGWYLDELGVARLGARPAVPFTLPYVVLDNRPDGKRLLIAAEDLTGLVPGAVVEGIEAATVRHELTPDTLRTHVFGSIGTWDRALGGLKRLIGVLTFETKYHKAYEYRVVAATSTHVDIVPARANQGLPELKNVETWGSIGCGGTPAEGSRCIVQFLDGEPFRPVVTGYEGPAGDGFEPEEIVQGGGHGRVIRSGDAVLLTGFAAGVNPLSPAPPNTYGVIALSPLLTTAGPPAAAPGTVVVPPAGYSRVKA